MSVTQPCADATSGRRNPGDHSECAGFVGGPRWPCECHCHPATYTSYEYAFFIVRQALLTVRSCPDTTYDADDHAARLVRDLAVGGVLDEHGAVDVR